MANFCLIPALADKFKEKLVSGEFNPATLASMTSEQRRKAFQEIMPETDAKNVNRLFESKLLLKNQQRGMVTWAKTVSGMKTETKRDLISRVQRMENILTPINEESFLEDLVEYRLGVGVTSDEANTISELTKNIATKEQNKDKDRMAWGMAQVEFHNYIDDLKLKANKMTLGEVIENPARATGKALKVTADTSRSLKASLDNSSIFRQGWKSMWTNPGAWGRNALQTFVDIKDRVMGKRVMDVVNADIMSRETYPLMKKGKLAVVRPEEAFPSDLPEKVPIFGRFYAASQDAYTGFLYRQRADIFDAYIAQAQAEGKDLRDENEVRAIAKVVNSLTGRADLGKLEPAADVFNSILFSPRLFVSHLDTLFLQPVMGRAGSSFAQKKAAQNLVKFIMGSASILAIASMFGDDDTVEWDPRSSDFGKIRIGDTRFDVSGGTAGVITLAARLLTGETKNTKGIMVKLGDPKVYKGDNRWSVTWNFFQNKFTPTWQVAKTLMTGKNFNGEPPTVSNVLWDMYAPIGIQNFLETAENERAANLIAILVSDALGISTGTYGVDTNWDAATSEEIKGFKAKLGDEDFKKANTEFNKKMNEWFDKEEDTEAWKSMSDEDKTKHFAKQKSKFKQDVFNDYGYKVKFTETSKYDDLLNDALAGRKMGEAEKIAKEYNDKLDEFIKSKKNLSKAEIEKLKESKINIDGFYQRKAYQDSWDKVLGGFDPGKGEDKVNSKLGKGSYGDAVREAQAFNSELRKKLGIDGLTKREKEYLQNQFISITGLKRRKAWTDR